MAIDPRKRHGLEQANNGGVMDASNPLQQLLVRGLGTTSLVAERLRNVTQAWVSSGRLDPSQASALVDDVLASLRGENPELEKQTERQVGRNLDHLLQDLGLARQREVDELRGRIDRLEQQLRRLRQDSGQADSTGYNDLPD
jgi:polyhydroxyalkanoate synthesis regulator phasin